jgi:redox-sensitive bicupin YhaK (pirin superfamily)
VDVRLEEGASTTVPLRADWEYAVIVMAGTADVADGTLEPGALCYLGTGRDALAASTASGARLFLLGGEPFADELVMWWNFVGRSHEEIVAAREAWMAGSAVAGAPVEGDRFGSVRGYDGAPLPAPDMPTTRLKPRDRHGRPMPGA